MKTKITLIKMDFLKSISLTAFILLSLIVHSQSHPPYPKVEKTFTKMKNMEGVYRVLKESYKIVNPKESKFEMLMDEGGANVPSYFISYKSKEAQRLNWLWPDDRIVTQFVVTTPKSSEGVEYVLPLIVEYTRLQYGALTTTYKFHRWYFANPISVKGGKEDALFMELLMQKLNSYEGNIFENKRKMPENLYDLISVKEIRKAKDQARRQVYSNVDNIIQKYVISGDRIEYDGWGEGKIKGHFVGSNTILEVTFTRDKDEKGNTGDWYISLCRNGRSNEYKVGVDNGDRKFYKTIGNSGFKAIYESQNITEIPIPYFVEQNNPILIASIRDAINNFFTTNGDVSTLKDIIAPGDTAVTNALVRMNDEFNKKFITLDKHSSSDGIECFVPVNGRVNEEVDKCLFTLSFRLDRQGYNKNKALKKIYKEGGMSKTELASFGYYYKSFQADLGFILIDGVLKVNSINLNSYPNIPF